MLQLYKSKISLQKAICTLKDCVDYHIINLHSHLLTEHIKKDKIYAQELYHILRELRKEGESDLNMLATELNMSEKIQDYKNSLEITTELIRRCPDNTKSKTWNKLKMIEKWIETHCAVVTIEEKLNYELNNSKSPTADILMDSILLATRGHLLLTKDWHYQHQWIKVFPSMSAFNWLSLIGKNKSSDFGVILFECDNLGYPMTADCIINQYALMASGKSNKYSNCLLNIEINILC